jgi:hypothetical protein
MRLTWEAKLGIALIAASVIVYGVHYVFFHDMHHILIYAIGDIAFVPVEVLLVTLIIHRLLAMRERKGRMEKLNMVIGAFYSEVGTELLAYLSDRDPQLEEIRSHLVVKQDWADADFNRVETKLRGHDYSLTCGKDTAAELKVFLTGKRDFMLRLIQNPNLLEHERFTDLLQAVFHLTEELNHRDNINGAPDSDIAHLAVDVERVYTMLVNEWLTYMHHLKTNYPFLFSLAMRTNPFDKSATPIVKS